MGQIWNPILFVSWVIWSFWDIVLWYIFGLEVFAIFRLVWVHPKILVIRSPQEIHHIFS